MESAAKRHLGWNERTLAAFLQKHASAIEACDALCKHPKSLAFGYVREDFQRLQRLQRLADAQWSGLAKLQAAEPTALEVRVVCEVNPFYAHFALRLPYEQCEELCLKLQVSVKAERMAYVLVLRLVLARGEAGLDAEQALQALQEVGIDAAHLAGVSTVPPYGDGVLDAHPLAPYDLRVMAEAEVKHLLHGGELVQRVRERNYLQNKLKFERGCFWLRTLEADFMQAVFALVRDESTLAA